MNDLTVAIPDAAKLVTIKTLLNLYKDRYGEEMPYVTLYAAAKHQRVPAFKFANRVVFQLSDVHKILAMMNLRAKGRGGRKRKDAQEAAT